MARATEASLRASSISERSLPTISTLCTSVSFIQDKSHIRPVDVVVNGMEGGKRAPCHLSLDPSEFACEEEDERRKKRTDRIHKLDRGRAPSRRS